MTDSAEPAQPVRFVPTDLAEGIRRVKEMDKTDFAVTERGLGRVPADECRCPITRVGDYCPIHGG